MPLDKFKRIAKEVAEYTQNIYLHVMGEPLLHPEIESFCEYCNEIGLYINLTTNGTLANKLYAITKYNSLRMINFSIHSFENSESMTDLDNYLQEILIFSEYARKHSPNLIICFRLWTNNFVKFENRNEYILKKIDNFFGLNDKTLNIEKMERGQKLLKNIYLSQANKFEWPDIKNNNKFSKGFCLALRDQIAILVDGTVVPCCLDNNASISLGNIFESSLNEILKSEKSKNLFDNFSKRIAVEELCKNCSYKNRFS